MIQKNNFLEKIQIQNKAKRQQVRLYIDPAFRNFNRLFFLSLKNGDNDPTRHFFGKYYETLIETTYQLLFDQNAKNKEEAYK